MYRQQQHQQHRQQQQQHVQHQERFKDVKCPFRVRVPPGESSFEVVVPKSYSNRDFYFSKLSLLPDYFSTQAANYGQDLDEELDAIVQGYNIYLTLSFNQDKLFGKRYDQEAKADATPKTIVDLLADINNYFEANKPTGMVRSPVFFDWIDIDLVGGKDAISDVVSVSGELYYNEPFNLEKHGNKLPPSVSDLPGVNTTLFPSKLTLPAAQERIRIRMHLAPATRAVFSTDTQLNDMGFTKSELGPRVGRKQLVVSNPKRSYAILTASDSPVFDFEWTAGPYTKLEIVTLKDTWVSPKIELNNMKRRDEQKNATLAEQIKKVIDKFSEWSNWDVNFRFKQTDFTFVFGFPDNFNVRATLYVSPALALRLGYGLVRHIDKLSVPENKPEQKDIKELTKMALALVFDTGLVIVSLKDSSSNTTSNIDNLFMADLEPEAPGELKMIGCDATTLVQVPRYMTGSTQGEGAKICFVLSRFNEQGNPVPFVWKTGAYVNGVLTGLPPSTLL